MTDKKEIFIKFDGTIPSKKNSKLIIFRKKRPFLIASANHHDWHEKEMILKRKFRNLQISECEIVYNFYIKTKRKFDLSNKVETINDFLVDLQVIDDDNYNIIKKMIVECFESDEDYCMVKVNYIKIKNPPKEYKITVSHGEGADFKCDGENDEIQISKAFEKAKEELGGTVFLNSPETYLLKNDLKINREDNFEFVSGAGNIIKM